MVSVSSVLVGYGCKGNVGENWDQVARGNRGVAGKGLVLRRKREKAVDPW
jgi:hypothetical protein